MRWTLLVALVGLVACKGLEDVAGETADSEDTSVETQPETGSLSIEVEFLAQPPVIGPLIIGLANGDQVFDNLIYTKTFTGPTFPENQTHVLEVAPGNYYIGAWIDEGSDSPDAPGAADPSGVAKMGGPTMATVERGATVTPPVIQLRRPDAGS